MVVGIEGFQRFARYMRGLEDSYVVIGGTACAVILDEAGLDFRATKDIDLILLVENRLPEVAMAVWSLVRDGGYTLGWKGADAVHFYRFTKPSRAGFPAMIEIFSRAPRWIELPDGVNVVPLPVGSDVSSLSAILLDDDYYEYVKTGQRTLDGVTVLDEVHLIPLKAKAYLDLSARRARGEMVDSRDIKKHKKDVFRLAQLLVAKAVTVLPVPIHTDMAEFCNRIQSEDVPFGDLGIPLTLSDGIDLLRSVYALDG